MFNLFTYGKVGARNGSGPKFQIQPKMSGYETHFVAKVNQFRYFVSRPHDPFYVFLTTFLLNCCTFFIYELSLSLRSLCSSGGQSSHNWEISFPPARDLVSQTRCTSTSILVYTGGTYTYNTTLGAVSDRIPNLIFSAGF